MQALGEQLYTEAGTTNTEVGKLKLIVSFILL